jgi:hypothetical protein
MAYRWLGPSTSGQARETSCRRTTDGLDLIVRTVGSR